MIYLPPNRALFHTFISLGLMFACLHTYKTYENPAMLFLAGMNFWDMVHCALIYTFRDREHEK